MRGSHGAPSLLDLTWSYERVHECATYSCTLMRRAVSINTVLLPFCVVAILVFLGVSGVFHYR